MEIFNYIQKWLKKNYHNVGFCTIKYNGFNEKAFLLIYPEKYNGHPDPYLRIELKNISYGIGNWKQQLDYFLTYEMKHQKLFKTKETDEIL